MNIYSWSNSLAFLMIQPRMVHSPSNPVCLFLGPTEVQIIKVFLLLRTSADGVRVSQSLLKTIIPVPHDGNLDQWMGHQEQTCGDPNWKASSSTMGSSCWWQHRTWITLQMRRTTKMQCIYHTKRQKNYKHHYPEHIYTNSINWITPREKIISSSRKKIPNFEYNKRYHGIAVIKSPKKTCIDVDIANFW